MNEDDKLTKGIIESKIIEFAESMIINYQQSEKERLYDRSTNIQEDLRELYKECEKYKKYFNELFEQYKNI